MIHIKSKAKKVLVFKSAHAVPLRIFPGSNSVPVDTVEAFSELYVTSEVASAMMKEYCSIVGVDDINKSEARASVEKNKRLNKAYKLMKEKIYLQTQTVDNKDTKIKDLEDKISALTKRIDEILKKGK